MWPRVLSWWPSLPKRVVASRESEAPQQCSSAEPDCCIGSGLCLVSVVCCDVRQLLDSLQEPDSALAVALCSVDVCSGRRSDYRSRTVFKEKPSLEAN